MVTQETQKDRISEITKKQRAFFRTGETLELKFRLRQLKKLYSAIKEHESEIFNVLYKDFKKSIFEAFGTEVALVQEEIKYFLKNLPRLMRPEKVKSSLASLPAKSYIYREPHGLSLIIGPWNYPVQLIFEPLVGAIAAGNCIVLKPSELAAHTSALVKKIVDEIYDESYVAVVEGGAQETQVLLAEKFDHIFFTGSVKIGKIVYEAAAKNLTPCVLELGGKSPCIVDMDADIDLAARRIVWGKFLNGGQTCVAPDYLMLHKSIKKPLLQKIVFYTKKHYGENPKNSPDYPRIINERNFNRLKSFLDNGQKVIGGESDPKEKFIAPTVLDKISWNDPVMQEEIFGPILPAMEFEDLNEALNDIKDRPKPLALYYFSKDKKKQEKVLKEVGFGGGCINDTMFQFGSPSIPVGGVGNSGMGNYHGKDSFYAFSNSKGIVKKSNKLDIPFRYPPYEGKLKLLRLIFKL
ncbi:MAG: aldehyde dehydrogenase [Cyclobacteriaceae bacterium]|nr:aldehyde dehydrogenase [Cyclobacteriaceae bacterium]